MDSPGIVIILLLYFNYIETSVTLDCFNKKTGLYECCQDYINVSGKCEACIGSWGKECRNNCAFGHYGFGCRYKCSCSNQQMCDPKQGCIEASTAPSSTTPNPDPEDLTTIEASLLVVSGLLILVLLCILLIFYRKLKKQRKPIQRCAGQEVIYDYVMDSRIIDNGGGEFSICRPMQL